MASGERNGRWARNAQKEQFWRSQVEGQAASGLSVRQWCGQEHLSEPSFYAWRRELARRDESESSRKRPHAATSRSASGGVPSPPANFLPVRLMASAASYVELALPSGLVIRVPAHETAALRAILEFVEPRPC